MDIGPENPKFCQFLQLPCSCSPPPPPIPPSFLHWENLQSIVIYPEQFICVKVLTHAMTFWPRKVKSSDCMCNTIDHLHSGKLFLGVQMINCIDTCNLTQFRRGPKISKKGTQFWAKRGPKGDQKRTKKGTHSLLLACSGKVDLRTSLSAWLYKL